MEKKLPRVLVPTINVWQDKGSVRTLPEIFSCWDKESVAQIYTRAALPDTEVCDRFLRIDEGAVLKSVFKRSTLTSKRVENSHGQESQEAKQELLSEEKRYARAKKRHSWFMTLCREMVWLLGKWKTPELDKFTEEFDPQIIFATVYPFVYIGRIQLYLIKKTGVPVVGYLFDDNISYKACGANPFAYIHRFWLRRYTGKLLSACDKLFVISPMLQKECKRLYNKDSVILTRPIDFSQKVQEKKPSEPIEMIYTGKLILDRDKTLFEIAKAVKDINKNGGKIHFEIYSADTPKEKYAEAFNEGGTHFCGAVSADKIALLQSNADITVFAEALKGKHRYSARLSFSTKLTDYLASGRCIFAVGNSDIAPMDYLKREDCAVCVNSAADIEAKLKELAENPSLIEEYGRKATACGQRNHRREKVSETFKSVMCSAVKKQ
ncbi:MAG: hypothetical protein ACI4GZ_02575 [Ruminococcus sp.]